MGVRAVGEEEDAVAVGGRGGLGCVIVWFAELQCFWLLVVVERERTEDGNLGRKVELRRERGVKWRVVNLW